MAFNFKQYTSNNPLLHEIEEDKDYTSAEEFDTMSDDELDAAGLTGHSDLGPNEDYEDGSVSDIENYGSGETEELEGMGSQMDEKVNYDKVNAVMDATVSAMRSAIKSQQLSTDDVHELRIKLAQFFA